MHPEALLEEDAAVFRDRRRVSEQVLEHGRAGPGRMHALRDLRELERIAQQDHVAGGRAHRESVRERDLTGLVDHEVVELAIQILDARRARRCRRRAGRRARHPRRSIRLGSLVMSSPSYSDSGYPPVDFFRPWKRTPVSRATFSISSSRLWIALWLCAAMPTRRPLASRWTMMRAPVHVLPGPGRALEEEVAARRARARALSSRRDRWSGSRPPTASPRMRGRSRARSASSAGIAPIAGADRFGDAQDGRALGPIVDTGRPRDQRSRERRAPKLGPRSSWSVPPTSSIPGSRPRSCPSRGRGPGPGASL